MDTKLLWNLLSKVKMRQNIVISEQNHLDCKINFQSFFPRCALCLGWPSVALFDKTNSTQQGIASQSKLTALTLLKFSNTSAASDEMVSFFWNVHYFHRQFLVLMLSLCIFTQYAGDMERQNVCLWHEAPINGGRRLFILICYCTHTDVELVPLQRLRRCSNADPTSCGGIAAASWRWRQDSLIKWRVKPTLPAAQLCPLTDMIWLFQFNFSNLRHVGSSCLDRMVALRIPGRHRLSPLASPAT